jgi:hypothetical protein
VCKSVVVVVEDFGCSIFGKAQFAAFRVGNLRRNYLESMAYSAEILAFRSICKGLLLVHLGC